MVSDDWVLMGSTRLTCIVEVEKLLTNLISLCHLTFTSRIYFIYIFYHNDAWHIRFVCIFKIGSISFVENGCCFGKICILHGFLWRCRKIYSSLTFFRICVEYNVSRVFLFTMVKAYIFSVCAGHGRQLMVKFKHALYIFFISGN